LTVEEARSNVEFSEDLVASAYRELKQNVKRVGESAADASAFELKKRTFAPLLISLIGIFLLFGLWYLGLPLIAGGIYLAYRLRGPAKALDDDVKELQKELNEAIAKNNNI